MPESFGTAAVPGPERHIALACPYCGKDVDVAERLLTEGGDLCCPHCDEICFLERERQGHGTRQQWLFIEDGDDEEP